MKQKEEIEIIDEEDKKTVTTAFFLMFPCFIIAALAVLYSPGLPGAGLAIALSIYQFFLLKKFIEDYYKKI